MLKVVDEKMYDDSLQFINNNMYQLLMSNYLFCRQSVPVLMRGDETIAAAATGLSGWSLEVAVSSNSSSDAGTFNPMSSSLKCAVNRQFRGAHSVLEHDASISVQSAAESEGGRQKNHGEMKLEFEDLPRLFSTASDKTGV